MLGRMSFWISLLRSWRLIADRLSSLGSEDYVLSSELDSVLSSEYSVLSSEYSVLSSEFMGIVYSTVYLRGLTRVFLCITHEGNSNDKV